jgi:hypothetical protein
MAGGTTDSADLEVVRAFRSEVQAPDFEVDSNSLDSICTKWLVNHMHIGINHFQSMYIFSNQDTSSPSISVPSLPQFCQQ